MANWSAPSAGAYRCLWEVPWERLFRIARDRDDRSTDHRHESRAGAWVQARAIALLPGVVAVLVPAFLLLSTGIDVGWGLGSPAAALPVLLGLLLIALGFALWLWTVRLFARVGEGTLAPWDPTRSLVAAGPYRHVRNPMILAVLAFLAGEAALFGSLPLLAWLAAFFAINDAFFRLHEEPELERRFGEEYRAYKRNVPRWLPRRTPWKSPP